LLIFEGKLKKSYTVTLHYKGFRPPNKIVLDSTVRKGNILSLAHAGILHFSMPEYISGKEVYKIPAMGEGQNVLAPLGGFLIPELQFFRRELHLG
jgi:hypothetical protein